MRSARNFLCCVRARDEHKRSKHELGIRLVDFDLNFLYSLHSLDGGYKSIERAIGEKLRTHQLRCLPESLHNNVRANTLLDVTPDLLEQLGSKENHTRRSISDLGVLGTGDIDQGFGSGVDDFKEFENGSTIVGNLGFAAVVDNKLVHTPWTESAGEGLRDGKAR